MLPTGEVIVPANTTVSPKLIFVSEREQIQKVMYSVDPGFRGFVSSYSKGLLEAAIGIRFHRRHPYHSGIHM